MKSIAVVVLALLILGTSWFSSHRHDNANRLVSAATAQEIVTLNSTPTLVGREVCGECHQENYHLHGKSGHASTFSSTRDSEFTKKFVGKTLDAGEPYGMFEYVVDDRGLSARRVGDPVESKFPLQYALGSGHNAVTFFSLLPDAADGTIGLEHHVSWFADHDGFGLSPGHGRDHPSDERGFFGNLIRGKFMQACVDCHTTSGTVANQGIVDLIANVNCEKCHGPGSEHVRQARRSDHPPKFSVGRADWNHESELQLCGDCHRLPRDISVKELREYPAKLARFQPVGMLRSKCYLESEGEMNCTTCHNPHQTFTAKSKQSYVDDCVACHSENSNHQVACPISPSSGCVECHMPPLKFEQGMILHDHWIRIREAE